MDTSEIIKAERIKLGLSQADVAKAVGVSETTVSRWETGKIANMKRSRIAALAKVLHIDPAIIMDGEAISSDWMPWSKNLGPDVLIDFNNPVEQSAAMKRFWEAFLAASNIKAREDWNTIRDKKAVENTDAANQRGEISLTDREQALNTLLSRYGLSFNKYTTKDTLTDYGFIGPEGGVSFSGEKFNRLLDDVEDSALQIYVRLANEGESEWLQRRRNQKYNLKNPED